MLRQHIQRLEASGYVRPPTPCRRDGRKFRDGAGCHLVGNLRWRTTSRPRCWSADRRRVRQRRHRPPHSEFRARTGDRVTSRGHDSAAAAGEVRVWTDSGRHRIPPSVGVVCRATATNGTTSLPLRGQSDPALSASPPSAACRVGAGGCADPELESEFELSWFEWGGGSGVPLAAGAELLA